ncbi:hypothetical protein PLESTF_001309200 [Pleodorina starrii]|nr:hypothetical protein PLESTF_001309200 [Pleodorina starrii]
MNAATASTGVQNLVFSKWKEIKHKAEPNNYIEFCLVTDTGNEVLAITAEDHGNSHYVYQSTGAFAKYGALNSKNRADTISWLEMIIKESQIKVDSQLAEEMAHAGEPTPDNPLGLYYTQHKAEKTVNPDGTHTQRFFLLDQYGVWHLAVVGEERETRDGHYLYKATEEFALRYPLSCHSQKDVIHWLEQRVTHNRTPPPLQQQRRTDGSGGASAAVSGGAGAASAGSADAWGPEGPGGATGVGSLSATTPTSAVDGVVGSDGAGLLSQAGDSSRRQPTPPPAAVAPCVNHEQQVPNTLSVPELLQQQQQQVPPQVPGLTVFPVAAAGDSTPGLLQQQPQQQAFVPPSVAAYCGVQPGGGAVQGTGEPPSPALQALDNVPPSASGPPSPLLPSHVGAHPSQAGQHQAGAQSPVLAAPHAQQQPSQNGAPQPPVGTHSHPIQQPGPGVFANSSGHAAPTLAVISAAASSPPSELAPLPLQQQQLDATVALQQRGTASLPTISHPQQEARSQGTSVALLQPQSHQQQHQQQQLQFPMLVDIPLQLQQPLTQGQPGSQAEPQGLAQLLGLAGLASSMSGAGGAPQLLSNGPPLQLQLPMPPQLQLQGSSASQLTTALQQQPQQQQQFVLPSVLFQQQQQPRMPLQPFSAQAQLQQEHQLQLLQKQIQQQQQHLQQLLQGGPCVLTLNNTGAQQQQELQIPGLMGAGGQPLPPPAASLQLTGPAPKALPALASGGQAWNAGGGSTPAACNAPQQSAEASARFLSPGQAGMPVQRPGLLSKDLSAQAAGAGLHALGPAPAALTGPVPGSPFNQVPAPAVQPLGAAGSGGTAPARTFGGPNAGGVGFGAVGSTGLQGPDQQPQLQPFGQPGGGLHGAYAAGNGGGVDALGGSGRATEGTGAAPASPTLGLPGGFSAPGGGSGSAAAGSAAAAAAAGSPLPQPFGAAGAQALPPGMPLSAVRTKEAGSAAGHHGARGGTGGRGSSGKHKLAGVAEVAHKRKLARLAAAGEEAVRLAQGAYLASLRHQALSEAAQQEALRKTIASWVRGQISEDELSVSGWHESLEQMLGDANRTRPVTVPFLAADRLTDVTRSSAEGITLAAAMSLAAPYDSAAQSRTPAPPPLPPPVMAPVSSAAAADGMAVAGASSNPQLVAGNRGPSEGGAGGGLGTGAVREVPSNAEQMAALSSLKALLEGNLTAAVLGSAAAATPAAAPDAAAAATAADGLQQAAGGSNGVTTEPVQMDAEGGADAAGQAGLAAPAGQPIRDVHMDDVSGVVSTPFAVPNAATAASGAAALPAAGGHPLPSDQPPPPPPAPPQAPAAPLPPPALHQQPPPLDVISLPAMPQAPSGPVGAAAVLACAGSATSWSFADPHLNRHGVRIALESLREVAALCPPVASMASSKLVETVKQYESHPHPSVSGLAKEILKRWRGSLLHRLRTMSDSRCYQDPVAALESKIQANEIVFPNLNELLGVPRGSSTAVADGAPPAPPAAAASPAAVGLPYTPAGAAPAGAGGSYGFVGSSVYSLTATPMAPGEGQGLAALPITPSLSLTAAGTPALTTVGTTTATFAAATNTPAGALGGASPGASLAATTTAETPRGLFDAAVAQGTSGAGSFPTPELFSRPSGAAAALAAPGPGVPPLEWPAALAPQPAAPVFPPMSLPAAAAAAAAPSAALVPQPLSPAAAALPLPPPQPVAAAIPPPPSPAAALVVPPQSPALKAAPLALPPAAVAQTPATAEAVAMATPSAGLPQQPQPSTPGQGPALVPPQPPSPAPPPPPALATGKEATAAAAAPVTAVAEAAAQAPAAAATAPGPASAAAAALLPQPSPVKAPAAAQAASAAALASALLPNPAKSLAAAGLAAVAGPATASRPAAAPAGTAPEPVAAPPSLSAGTLAGMLAPLAVPAFGAPSPRLPGLPTPTQAATAEVAALLAASAQSLAAHIQTTSAAGGSVVPPPPSFSPAQLSQLGALASTTKVYASALKTSDAAGAASALQTMVQQLRQAHALNLGLGGSSLRGGRPQRPLFLPSPSTSAGASAASPAQQQTLLPASWPSVNWACSLQPPQAPLLMQPLQIQPLQIQPTPSSSVQPSASSTSHPRAAGTASQAAVPAQKDGLLSQGLRNAAACTGQATGVKTASVTTTPGVGTQAGAAAAQADAGARDDAATAAGAPPPLAASPTQRTAAGNPEPPSLPGAAVAAADSASAPSVGAHGSGLQAAAGGGEGGAAAAATGQGAPVEMEVDGANGAAAGAPGPQQNGVLGQLAGVTGTGASGQDRLGEGGPAAGDETAQEPRAGIAAT